ncbi:MAG: pyridoxal phosphate-dependent aminotransferase [Acidobacteria bacterium]|jgi:aspartate aminotransferase|nr:pyridoxal phosphate-dependent aminotransferase [Acidobacteriota bacterium]
MNSFTASRNVQKMQSSSTMKAAQAAAQLREEGHDVIDLTLGEPDFQTPKFIKDYAWEGLQKGLTKYTPTAGLKSFQEAIAGFYALEFGTKFSPKEIVAACGGKQALFNAACTLLNPGDEVLIPKPYWVTFPEIVNFTDAKNVFIETEETGFVLTAEQVKNSITDKTRLLILNSPNNPTGRVIPPDEMRKIVEVCAENEVYVLTDECYLFFVYPPAEVFTSASLPEELRKYVCVAGSFSKTYAMTGWRIGYTIANEEWSNQMSKLQSHSTSHPTSFVQYACARAMENYADSKKAVNSMLSEYKIRKSWLIPALQTIEGFECAEPEGAFYAFVDVRQMLGDKFKTSADVSDLLLNEAHVVVTDGKGFGADGFLRISYATSIENLQRAVERMKNLLNSEKKISSHQ